MSNELPEPWGSALSGKGVHSYGDLAAAVGISKGTAHRLVNGKGTSVETAKKVADYFFAGDVDVVWKMRGSSRRDYGPWMAPAEVSFLTPKQRAALEAVISAMVPEEREEGDGDGDAASTKVRNFPPPPDMTGGQRAARSSTKHPPRGPREERD